MAGQQKVLIEKKIYNMYMNRVIIRYSHVESLGKCRRVSLKTLMLLKILFNINSPFGFVIFNIVY